MKHLKKNESEEKGKQKKSISTSLPHQAKSIGRPTLNKDKSHVMYSFNDDKCES